MQYNSIRPGKEWLDTEGKPIQAHGFQVFYDEKEKRWIWYGENKEDTKKGGTVWTKGIRWYTSGDLYNWEDQGLLIPPSDDLNEPLHPTYCIDRPHIIYCEKTGKYVCWIKVMASEIAQFMIVLQSDRFEGPYEYVHRFYNPLKPPACSPSTAKTWTTMRAWCRSSKPLPGSAQKMISAFYYPPHLVVFPPARKKFLWTGS